MNFNNAEYNELISSLTSLAGYLKKEKCLDKELALYLYTIPQMIRNVFISFDQGKNKTRIGS